MERAKSGEPLSKYWGPAAKLVSWAAEYPVRNSRKQERVKMRTRPP
jgi:hypothetical protein